MAVIKWKSGIYTGETGWISGERIKVAYIGWGVVRVPGEPWVLTTELPGFKKMRTFATVEEAKECAEKILASFVQRATTHLPESEA